MRTIVESIRWQIQGMGTDSFVAEYLKDCYSEIAEQRGHRMKIRMHTIMTTYLSARNQSFVDATANGALKVLTAKCKDHREDMHKNVDKIIEKLDDNFKTMLEDLPPDEDLKTFLSLLSEFSDKCVKPKVDKIDDLMKQLQRQYASQSE